MKNFFVLFFLMIFSQAFAAPKSTKASPTATSSLTDSLKMSASNATAVISTNVADISKNRANVSLDVLMTYQWAATLSYSTSSQEEVRERIASHPKLTVDRTQFGLGADYFLRPLTAISNLSLAPALIFETERDAVDTGSTTGVGLRAMGILKPFPRLMAQGGAEMSIVGSETRTNLLIGMGLVF